MINITVSSNTNRKKIIVDENTTLRDVLTNNGINANVGQTSINGEYFSNDALDRTLAELNIRDGAFITKVAKADNA